MKLNPVVPFEPVSAETPPVNMEDWIAQVKWDGVRMLIYCDGSETKLINRRLHDRTQQYPEFQDVSRYCSARSFILDGEMIAFDHAKPSFPEVMKRDSLRTQSSIQRGIKQVPVTYMVFDVLYHDGIWVTDQSLLHRQSLLRRIVQPNEQVQLVDNFNDPAALLHLMKQRGMEGIVCKDLNSAYAAGGKDRRWQKIKIFHDLHAVVGGVTFRAGTVNALLLGVYRGDKLMYIGHAGTGKLSVQDWRDITERIQPLIVQERTFANVPERSKDAVWVKPELVVKVTFMEWTPGGTMRHPSIQAFVDLPPDECRGQ